MKPESQRIMIAEQLPNLVMICQREPVPILLWKNRSYNVDFDPLNDLNAMHEAEKMLTVEQGNGYSTWLDAILDSRNDFDIIHATAVQRAEAFLRTLNLWTE